MNKIARIRIGLAACLLGVGAAGAHAEGAKDLARAHACFTCHAMSGNKVGPGFAQIAAKFAGKPDARKVLVDAMEHGEKGTFGGMPMPAQSALSESDAQQLADWILGLKP